MLTFIAASSLELCFDDYHVEPGSVTRRALHVMDILFTVVFGMEAVFKILVLGLLFNGPSSYMRRFVQRGVAELYKVGGKEGCRRKSNAQGLLVLGQLFDGPSSFRPSSDVRR